MRAHRRAGIGVGKQNVEKRNLRAERSQFRGEYLPDLAITDEGNMKIEWDLIFWRHFFGSQILMIQDSEKVAVRIAPHTGPNRSLRL